VCAHFSQPSSWQAGGWHLAAGCTASTECGRVVAVILCAKGLTSRVPPPPSPAAGLKSASAAPRSGARPRAAVPHGRERCDAAAACCESRSPLLVRRLARRRDGGTETHASGSDPAHTTGAAGARQEGAHREAHGDPACQPRERAHTRERSCALPRRDPAARDAVDPARRPSSWGAWRSARWGSVMPRAAAARADARGWVLCIVALAAFPQAARAFRAPLPSTPDLATYHPLGSRPLPALQRARRGAALGLLEAGAAACGLGLGQGRGTTQAASAVRGVLGAWGPRRGEVARGVCVGLRRDAHAGREVRQRSFSHATATHAARRGGSSGSSGSNGSNGSSRGGSSGGGRQGSGRRSSGNDDFKDRRPADRWDGPLDPEWELRLRAARSPDKMRGVVRDPWQDKLLKRVFLPKTPQQAMLQVCVCACV